MKTSIKFLIMDVDGTLTDGKIYMGPNGEVMKAFDVKDGCGIKDILPRFNIIPVIITARNSQIVVNRSIELSIENCYQGIRNKTKKIEEVLRKYSLIDGLNYSFQNVAYIGDDILDMKCMVPVKEHGGVIGCPMDAIAEIKSISDFVSTKNGGDGAVREFIEWIIQ